MLKKLTIEQFVIIDKLELEFRPGLTVLTGETGAGKSILLDALGLILGDPPSPSSIRQGSDQSVVEALFQLPIGSLVWKFLGEKGLASPTQQELLIRRVIRRDGHDDLLLNGRVVELDILKKAGALLSEIHGQFANQSLLDPSNQMVLLDLSGAFTPETYKNVVDELNNLKRYKRELEEESEFYKNNIQLVGRMEGLVAKFIQNGLNEMDIRQMQSEYARLLTAYETCEAFQEIIAHLIASNGAIKNLSAANVALERQKNLDAGKMKDLHAFLAASLQNARSAVNETNRLTPEYTIDTKPLHLLKSRLANLKKMAEEVKVDFNDLSIYYNDLVARLNRARNSRERMAELGELIQKTEYAYRHHAHILTEKRQAAGNVLSAAINAGLPPLKLMSAEFKVLVEERPGNPWTELGFNTITFTARMNPGMPFSPIAETASGGELARLVLALKAVLQGVQAIPMLVFDEVDTGIGGAAAAAVGERIAHLAEKTQVMAITHSPQVASRGDQHLHVSKKTDGVTTTSVIRKLTLDERINEVSRMLAGDKITPEAHAAAKMLIEEASAAATLRRENIRKEA